MRIAILISGRGSNMRALLDAAKAPDFPADVALVLSNKPDAAGLQVAADAGFATAIVDHKVFGRDREAFERAMQAELEKARVELVCLAGFMRLLTPWFVSTWHNRLVNIHPSLLPAFKGLDTHQRALDAGVTEHGCTVHLVRPEMDTGPVLGQAKVTVAPGDDAARLAARVLEAEHLLYPRALEGYIRGLEDGGVTVEGDAVAGITPVLLDYGRTGPANR
ncbi:MAG: phosphoribosylglycinamide formyltransferase [Devosiaceae bacterium]|nr:phosphoribosylglycinamide formyltransferase [Devosiaceae bacterium MH13]